MLALVVASVLCGEQVSLSEKVFGSATVVEFTVSYAEKKPTSTGKVLLPVDHAGPAPELKFALTSGSPCEADAKRRGHLKLLAFFAEDGRQLVGVEQSQGHGTDLDPAYPELVLAVLQAKGWKEERMRAVAPDQLWEAQRNALRSENPFLRRLAADFLVSHDAAQAVDAAWGARGTPARKQKEAKAGPGTARLCPARK